MNKRNVEAYLPAAIKAIKTCGIADKNNVITGNYRSQISAFNAAVLMGSPLAAIAFYSKRGAAASERTKLMDAIYLLLNKIESFSEEEEKYEGVLLFTMARKEKISAEKLIDAALAIKLALNYYEQKEGKQEKNMSSEATMTEESGATQ